MSQSDEATSDDTVGTEATEATGWFAKSSLRLALTIIGLVILLFALGQVVGLDLIGVLVDILESTIGRWLIVAFFGLLLIALAIRGFEDSTE